MSDANKHQRSATIYQSLYLMNLLLLPGFSFLALIWIFIKNKQNKGWHIIHLYRAIQLSFVAGILLVLIPLVVVYGGSEVELSIMIILVYFVTIHALLVLLGMFNISRAMAKKLPIF